MDSAVGFRMAKIFRIPDWYLNQHYLQMADCISTDGSYCKDMIHGCILSIPIGYRPPSEKKLVCRALGAWIYISFLDVLNI